MLGIKAGQLLTTVNLKGLFVLSVPHELIKKTIRHEDSVYSKRIPIGEIFLCLDIQYYDTEFSYGIKILWKENIYYVFCGLNEIRVVE